jgi:hypothetical protein
MVITPQIVCDTCDTKHLLKVTLGRENNQYHAFPCTECEEEIEFGLEGLFSSGEYRYIKNCSEATFEYHEAIQVHLNPDFGVGHKVVKAGDIITATYSNVLEMQRIAKEYEKDENEGVVEHRVNYENFNSESMRFYVRICSLLKKEKAELADKYIKKNHAIFKECEGESLNYYLSKLLNHIVGGYGLELIKGLKEEKSKAGDLSDLIQFNNQVDNESFGIFEEFITLFNEFSQVFTYLNRGVEIVDRIKVTSTDFNRTKKYYSSAYEALAKMLHIPAGINNSIERGDPHKFEIIDSLDKYVRNGNGDKLRCISQNHNLNKISDCYDNHIRNASFHNNMKYNPKKSKISFKKNNGTPVTITYKEYLVMCIKITEALAALNLFALEELQQS